MTHPFARRERSLAIIVLATLVAGLLSFLVVAGPAKANHGTRNLNVSPDVASKKVTEGAHRVTAQLLPGEEDPPTPGDTPIQIDFEVESGPADVDGGSATSRRLPDYTCSISGTSTSCFVDIPNLSATAGTSFVRAWIDHDATDEAIGGQTEADTAEGRLSSRVTDCTEPPPGAFACEDPGATEVAGTSAEPDITDVVSLTWTGAPARLDCLTESQTRPRGAVALFDCRIFDSQGLPVAGEQIDGENQDSANDPDSADGGGADYQNVCGNNTESTADNTSDANGRCDVSIPGSGEFGAVTGTAEVCFWIDDDDDSLPGSATYAPNATDAAAADDGGGGSGTATGAKDCGPSNGPAGADSADIEPLAETTAQKENKVDRVTVLWQEPELAGLDLTPETTTPSLRPGTTHTVTATLVDQFGQAWAGKPDSAKTIGFEFFAGSVSNADGNTPGSPDKTCDTAASSGSCAITFTSSSDGSDLICGWFGSAPVLSGSVPSGTCDGENTTEQGGSKVSRLDVVAASWFTPTTTTGGGGGGGTTEIPQGYALVGTDGGIFNYGTAEFHGSTGDIKLNKPVVGMAYLPGGNGYWMVASDGGIFTFGKAEFHGSMASSPLNAPIIGMEATPDGKGYWLFASDGGIFSFGNASSQFFGSAVGLTSNQVIGMGPTPTYKGYWIADNKGAVFPFGDAKFLGDMRNTQLNGPIIAFTTIRKK